MKAIIFVNIQPQNQNQNNIIQNPRKIISKRIHANNEKKKLGKKEYGLKLNINMAKHIACI